MFVAASFADEIGFEPFQAFGSDGNVPVQKDGFVYESFCLDFGHGNESGVEVSCRAPRRTCSRSGATRTVYTPFFAGLVSSAPFFLQCSGARIRRALTTCENF